MFPDLTRFRWRKNSIFYLKTKHFHSKIPQKIYGRNRKSKYIHEIVIFQVTILEISRRRALNWFWIELQFMPSNWMEIELNKKSLNRTCLVLGYVFEHYAVDTATIGKSRRKKSIYLKKYFASERNLSSNFSWPLKLATTWGVMNLLLCFTLFELSHFLFFSELIFFKWRNFFGQIFSKFRVFN